MPAKLLIAYNVKPDREETYLRFMMGEFLPTMQSMGLIMIEGWHTAWGNYPQRLIGLITEDRETIDEALTSDRWREVEAKLVHYVTNYQRQLVPYRTGFQFLKPL